eukprot:TRINITY_DN16412_c0_g1_i1.p1 TRINITY_DN16412_c0_g1~~TRINITY_DN16412_c0_g1_i1.p1  ORF type:complete len:1371 (+),score=268.65 TRINITY_DN16412_c0_g1_i1:54-4115(+)
MIIFRGFAILLGVQAALSQSCNTLTPQPGTVRNAVALPAGGVTTGTDVTTYLSAETGKSCTGTATATCLTAGGTATSAGMTCTNFACTAGTITTISGMELSGTPIPASISTDDNIAAYVQATSGYTCTGTALAVCATAGANPVTPKSITCPANACTAGTLTLVNGLALSGVTVPASVATATDLTTYVTQAAGYTCTGTATALCLTAGANPATVTGITCPANACTQGTLTPPTGSVLSGVTVPASISTGADVTSLLTAAPGYTCTGTALALCVTAGNNPADATYTCTPNTCSGGLTPTPGASPSGATVPATIQTGTDVSSLVTATLGYTCTGTALAVCTTAGANAASTTGHTCTANTCTGGLTPPSGAQLSGAAPASINTGDVVSSLLTPSTGFTCMNAAVALCRTAGANLAETTGMVCTSVSCSGLTPPTGAQLSGVTLPAAITSNMDMTTYLTQQAGMVCTGTPLAVCGGAGQPATTTGMTCTAAPGCTGGLTPPLNAERSAVALPASITQGLDVTQYLSAKSGYTCSGVATAVCANPGAVPAGTTGTFACVALSCNSVQLPTGITNGNVLTSYPTGQTITTVETGYTCTGTRVATCLTAGGVANIPLTCNPNSCTGGLNIPMNSQLSGVSLPTTINSGVSLSQYVVQPTGVTCTGTPIASCSATGTNKADVIGYTCTNNVCTAGLEQPANSISTVTGSVSTGQDVTSGITPATGYTCVNNIKATCVTAGSKAVVTPAPCSGLVCPLGMTPPTGTTTSSTSAVTTGQNVITLLSVVNGYTCTGTPIASCTNTAVKAAVTGYSCTPISGNCAFSSTTVGYLFSGGANCNTVSNCGTVSCASGYNGANPTLTCPASGVFVASGCSLNVCQAPGTSFPGYTLTGGNSCTSTANCGSVSCSSGYRQVSTPSYACNTNGGVFAFSGCTSINTCSGSGNGQTGYVFTCPTPTTCTVACASGYTGTAALVCLTNGGTYTAQGCVASGGTPSPVANVPTRAWKRSSLTFFPEFAITDNTAEFYSYILALEQKLRAASDRFRTDAELKVSLLCVTGDLTRCVRPDVIWERSSRNGEVLSADRRIQSLGLATEQHTADVIVSDYTIELVDSDLSTLESAITQNGQGTGPIFNNNKDFKLNNGGITINTADQLVSGPTTGGVTTTPTPIPGAVSGSSDDDGLPTWAIILIIVGILLCCCIIILCYCYQKKKKKKEKQREMEENGDYKMTDFNQAAYRGGGGAGSTSAEEAAKVARLQDQVQQLEKQKASPQYGSYGGSPGAYYQDRVPSESSMPGSQGNPYQWKQGDPVEVLYAGEWCPGVINSSKCIDGGWDIDWCDGTGSVGISYRDIRPPGGWEANTHLR